MPAVEVHAEMTDRLTSGSMRFLLAAACIVIIAWGIKAASDILSLILLGFLLAYSALPLVKWIMHRFHLRKSIALVLAGGLVGTLQVVLVFLVYKNAVSMKEKLPTYAEHARNLYQHVTFLLLSHSIDITGFSASNLFTANEIVRFAQLILPQAGHFFSNGLTVVLLGWICLSIIAEDGRASAGSILAQIQNDVAHYISVAATTGVLTALVNLVLLVALGVDFPVLWCVLYFFLCFIPNIGFVFALVPPSCVALLMLGWKRALLVAGGLVLSQLVSSYAINPMFLRIKGMRISFMEIMLSMMGWGFLLGPAGSVLGVPLTLAMKRFIPDFFKKTVSQRIPDAPGIIGRN